MEKTLTFCDGCSLPGSFAEIRKTVSVGSTYQAHPRDFRVLWLFHSMDTQELENDELMEFDFYLQWEWPSHIEESLRRMLLVSLIEACEPDWEPHRHTSLLRWQIATYPESPSEVLDYLANFDEPLLLSRIAENPRTWLATLTRLAKHKSWQVRAAVAENTRLPLDAMKILSNDECPDVCYAMASNPHLPPKLLHQLSTNENPYVAEKAALTLARRSPVRTEELPLRHWQKRRGG